jgi:hypothetical protein
MERVFIDFVCPLPRTRRGNIAILVVLDGLSKFNFFPVSKISSAAVVDCLEKTYFPAFRTPDQLVSDNASVNLEMENKYKIMEDKIKKLVQKQTIPTTTQLSTPEWSIRQA